MKATRRILVAGIGNIFLGDDAFGSEVARRLHMTLYHVMWDLTHEFLQHPALLSEPSAVADGPGVAALR